MTDDRVKALWKKGVKLMGKQYTWAEAILQVLREDKGWDATPYQWATAGYMGAIDSGKTICGILFGGSIYLGFLNGMDATEAPKLKDKRRLNAIKSVNELFKGFINQFGESDCKTLTGCDWSKKEDIKRYFKDQIYKDTCYRQFEYVVEKCISAKALANR